jgi:proton-dependent oligopeptide transporter, POT family
MNSKKAQNLKQPKVFYLACFTSVCERFGFYVLSFLLVLYMKNVYNLTDTMAFALFAVFTALVYVTPAIGGYLADNIFGIRRSIIFGLLLEGVGLNLLAFPGKFFFVLGLAFIIIGVGFFKTGPTNLMARTYKENDPRIDSGFTLFYMSINIGSFLAPVAAGFVRLYYGWHAAFFTAALVLYFGLIGYFVLRGFAKHHDSPPGEKNISLKVWVGIFAGTIIAILVSVSLLTHIQIANVFFFVIAILIGLYFMFEIARSPKEEKLKILACLFLIITGMVFFILYFQLYESMTLFIERSVVHSIFGIPIPMTVFLGFNAFWIIALSPILAWLYEHLGKSGKDLAVTTKFPLGILITSLCFFVLVFGTYFTNVDMRISGGWILFSMFFYSLGELLISALGVAMVTRIVPKRMYGVMMGAWYLIACALASAVSGRVADLASVPEGVTDPAAILHIYSSAFLKMGIAGVVAAIVVFIVSPYIKKIAELD